MKDRFIGSSVKAIILFFIIFLCGFSASSQAAVPEDMLYLTAPTHWAYGWEFPPLTWFHQGGAQNSVYELGEYLYVDSNNDSTIDPMEPCIYPLQDSDVWGGAVPTPYESAGWYFPYGLFRFKVKGLDPGGRANVQLLLHRTDQTIENYFKFGLSPGNPNEHWYLFDMDENGQGAEIIHDESIKINMVLQDGQRGDYDLQIDGIIIEPGAPAREIVTTDSSGGGCFIDQ